MSYPCIEDVKKLLENGDYGIIPVTKELYADRKTPIEVLSILKNVSRHCYILESAENNERWGRYTFLGYDPVLELTCHNHEIKITTGITITEKVDHPGDTIRKILSEYKSPVIEGLPPFTGGFVGFFSYDYIRYSEPVLDEMFNETYGEEDYFKDMDLMLFDKVIAFDNYRQKIYIIVNCKTDNIEVNYKKALHDLENISRLITTGEKAENKPLKLKSEFKSKAFREDYCGMVTKAKEYIHEGDIFQVVLSNRMEAAAEGSLYDTYRILRCSNPSPYMFYFSSDDIEIAGASPETLVKLENGKLFTYPLAGTRPRGATKEEDDALEDELLADEKELAEHNMLVDLGRNDIGKISKLGTVRVEDYMNILRFSHVMHIGSTVTGQIREGYDAIDAIDSILPAGTLSGAPKIRACEIINELEQCKRGIYGGAIGYIDFHGNMDTCIAIRLAYKKNGKLFIRSGAGIVADSVPEKEYEESINKAMAVKNAIMEAEGGID